MTQEPMNGGDVTPDKLTQYVPGMLGQLCAPHGGISTPEDGGK